MWKKDDGKGDPDIEEAMMDEKSAKPSLGGSDKAGEIIAFIGKGVEFKGTIIYSGTVRIDGHLEGELETDGVLIVGEGAVITAKVTAGTVICQGHITGDVIAKEKIKLLAPAVVDGSVAAPLLSIEEGVLFNGSLEMKRSEAIAISREVLDARDSLVRAIGDTRSATYPSARG